MGWNLDGDVEQRKEVQDAGRNQCSFCTSLKPSCGLRYVQFGTTDLGTKARLEARSCHLCLAKALQRF